MYIKVISESETIFPYDLKNLKKDNPNTAFPRHLTEEFLETLQIFKVLESKPDTVNCLIEKLVAPSVPTQTERGWELVYTKELLSEGEALGRRNTEIRRLLVLREQALKDTDWYVIRKSETGLPIPEEILTYRQTLRDITESEGFPENGLPELPKVVETPVKTPIEESDALIEGEVLIEGDGDE